MVKRWKLLLKIRKCREKDKLFGRKWKFHNYRNYVAYFRYFRSAIEFLFCFYCTFTVLFYSLTSLSRHIPFQIRFWRDSEITRLDCIAHHCYDRNGVQERRRIAPDQPRCSAIADKLRNASCQLKFANCQATVQKLLVRQVLNKSNLWS